MMNSGGFVTIDYSMFFDRRAVTSRVDRAKLRGLSKAGAFVRRRARTLMRKRKTKTRRVSDPGGPPLQHAGGLRRVFFGLDRDTDSVVIGPALNTSQRPGGKTVPELIEFGGRVRQPARTVPRRDGSRRVIPAQTLTYEPRPYMGPALADEAPKFPELFKVKG